MAEERKNVKGKQKWGKGQLAVGNTELSSNKKSIQRENIIIIMISWEATVRISESWAE